MRAIQKRYVFAITCVVLVSGCASLDEGECAVADWRKLGFEDGRDGESREMIASYASDCAEFGISADPKAYDLGWEQGIREYCTRDNGFKQGFEGYNYGNVCPDDLRDAFFGPYQLGRSIAYENERLRDLQRDLDQIEIDIEEEGKKTENRNRSALKERRRDLQDDLSEVRFRLNELTSQASEQGFYVPVLY